MVITIAPSSTIAFCPVICEESYIVSYRAFRSRARSYRNFCCGYSGAMFCTYTSCLPSNTLRASFKLEAFLGRVSHSCPSTTARPSNRKFPLSTPRICPSSLFTRTGLKHHSMNTITLTTQRLMDEHNVFYKACICVHSNLTLRPSVNLCADHHIQIFRSAPTPR